MPRGNLRPAAAMRELPESFLERKRDLLTVPAAREPGFYCLTPRELDPETGEAQRPRALDRRILILFAPEPVARFLVPAPRAERPT